MSAEAQARAALDAGLAALKRGQPANAVDPLRHFLRLVPDHPEGLHLLANALGQMEQQEEARALVERAIARDGRRAAFHNTLGNILKAQGDTRAALRAYARAIELEPRMLGARFNQGLIHLEDGRLEEAGGALDDVLAAAPAHYDALTQRGVVAWKRRDLSCAVRHFEAAIRVRPDDAAAHDHLGVVLLHDGQFAKARDVFEMAHALAPTQVRPQLNLARARRALGDMDGAAAVLTEALDERPQHAGLLSELAGVRQAQGRLDEAKEHYLAALTLAEEPVTAASLTELYLWQNNIERAHTVIKPYPAASAPQVAIVRARLALRSNSDLPDSSSVLSWLEGESSSSVSAAERRQLHFCAGDLLHRAGDEAAAFEHYGAGNALSPGRFDGAAHTRFVGMVMDAFSDGRFAQLARTNAADVGPLFIVGMPRSGTTLVEQMLGMHPKIATFGERVDVGHWPRRLAVGDNWRDAVGALTTGQLNAVARDYLQSQPVPGDVSWITDKMPVNFLYLGLIAMVFPRAVIVHCRRDPSAVALSCFRQDFQDRSLSFSNDLEALAEYTANYERLMAHWHKVLPQTPYDLEYEQLVREPDQTLRDLLSRLDLPFDNACLAFYESSRFANTASHQQVREPVYTRALARHERYATQLAPFTLALARYRERFSLECAS